MQQEFITIMTCFKLPIIEGVKNVLQWHGLAHLLWRAFGGGKLLYSAFNCHYSLVPDLSGGSSMQLVTSCVGRVYEALPSVMYCPMLESCVYLR